LEDRKYDAILFRNGYAKDAPEMLVEFRVGRSRLRRPPARVRSGLRRYGKERKAYYAIRLGKISRIRRWDLYQVVKGKKSEDKGRRVVEK
jgi:hypothetical protein